MKKFRNIPKDADLKRVIASINTLGEQQNDMIEEVRLIKRKLRVNAHFSTKKQ